MRNVCGYSFDIVVAKRGLTGECRPELFSVIVEWPTRAAEFVQLDCAPGKQLAVAYGCRTWDEATDTLRLAIAVLEPSPELIRQFETEIAQLDRA